MPEERDIFVVEQARPQAEQRLFRQGQTHPIQRAIRHRAKPRVEPNHIVLGILQHAGLQQVLNGRLGEGKGRVREVWRKLNRLSGCALLTDIHAGEHRCMNRVEQLAGDRSIRRQVQRCRRRGGSVGKAFSGGWLLQLRP